jgi:hypothetical protein
VTVAVDHDVELAATHALADGELAGAEADAARTHLATCPICQAELADIVQLEALPPPAPRIAPVIELAWYRRRTVQVGAAVAMAAAAAIALVISRPRAREQHAEHVQVALAPHRAIEARLSWSVARAYRPYDVPRAAAPAREPIALATLADVDRAGDVHGVGVLALLDGDRARAAQYLERAAESADVLADRAALALADGAPDRALALADRALALAADHGPAMWNRALALRELGLSSAAAAAFRAVAAHGEPGWATEATSRADALEKELAALYELSLRVAAAAGPIAHTGSGLSVDDARALPGMSRIELYDALRAAPDAARIAALRPLADAIDAADHTHDAVASVDRARPDRAAADAYDAILAGHPPDRASYLAHLRAAHDDDRLIGALVKLGTNGRRVQPDELAEFARLTAASSDPWEQLLGIEQRASAAADANDLPGEESILLAGRAPCDAGAPSFRCMKLAVLRGYLYLAWGRLPEARAALGEAWQRARAGAQWEAQEALLPQLAELAEQADDSVGGGLSLARAYTEEMRARADREQQRGMRAAGGPYDACQPAVWGRSLVASILVDQLRFADAARELAAAPPCDVAALYADASVIALYVRAEVARVVGNAAEVTAVRDAIGKLRGAPNLSAGDQAFLDLADGRLVIDRDPAAGEKLLRGAIARTSGAPSTDLNARKAAAFSYSVLAVAAAVRGDGDGALATLAQELGVPPPARCALGLAVEDRDAVAIVRGADGKVVVHHETRTATAIDPDALVPADLRAALAGCTDVDVIARPPIEGTSRLLPDDIAWRYLAARPQPLAPGPIGDRALVIADVAPPAGLGLAPLATWTRTGDVLSGAAATPSHVLAAIGGADDVIVHAHGIADRADASYLALSPDGQGRYALTAADVRAAKLAHHPVVVLAACSAANAAPVLHERWSLPAAFVFAGARAVLAPAAPIPDADAAAFFDDLRARIHAGADAAVALRDARVAWLASGRGEWVRDVIVFE